MFSQDLKKFVQLLNENQVNCIVIGGYAVAVHKYSTNKVRSDLSEKMGES